MTARQILQHNVLIIRTFYRQWAAQVMLISFPKSGRTWLRTLVGKALCDHLAAPDGEILKTYELTRRAGLPLAEVTHDGSAIEDALTCHELSTNKRRYASKKVVFLVRDVRDVVVSSYFHATKRARVFRGGISEFIRHDRYGARKILAFNRIWEEQCAVPRDFMLVRYEDLHADPALALVTVADFMGLPAIEPPLAARAVEFASFSNMRRLETDGTVRQGILRPARSGDEESFKVRKGIVGGYRAYLSESDVDFIDAVVRESGMPFAHRPSLVPRSQWSAIESAEAEASRRARPGIPHAADRLRR